MIYRYMYTGFTSSDRAEDLRHPSVKSLSLSRYGNQLFLYLEATEEVAPEAALSADMIPYPDGALWFRMLDVFHYSRPFSEEEWKRKEQNKTPWIRINYLVPEKTASYIFYHYQFQEENPGAYDKYGIVYLYGNLLVHYLECPLEKETLLYEGALKTHNTPVGKEAWDDMIEKHFIPWEDEKIQNDPNGPWLAIENVTYRLF